MNGFQEFRARHMAAGMRQMTTPDIRWEELEDRLEDGELKCESTHWRGVPCTVEVTHMVISACPQPDRRVCASAAADAEDMRRDDWGCMFCHEPAADCWRVVPWG